MHKAMVPVSVLGLLYLQAVANSPSARLVALGFGLAGVGLFAASGLAHHKVWKTDLLHKLFLLDQSMIMVYITASTAVVAHSVGGTAGWALCGGMALMATLGITLLWLPFHPPRGMTNTVFFVLGWWPILFVGRIADSIGSAGLVALLAGGAVFTGGALIVGFQKPDPNPEVFGYHEIWHVLVILGSTIHFWLFAQLLSGNAPL